MGRCWVGCWVGAEFSRWVRHLISCLDGCWVRRWAEHLESFQARHLEYLNCQNNYITESDVERALNQIMES